MRPLYLLALLGTRLVSVLSLLVLSHLMTPKAFGEFTLINTNALAAQMILGSWLSSIVTRSMASRNGDVNPNMMAAITSAVLIVSAITLGASIVYGCMYPDQFWGALMTAILASSFIIYDTALAIKNAMGRESAYAAFALSRNLLAFIVATFLVIVGTGSFGPVVGLLIGTLTPLIFLSGTRRLWLNAKLSMRALRHLSPYLSQGLSGALVLGIYILVNAPIRNLIAQEFGVAAAGVWTLCSDLFYGPLAIVGNAYSLSQIRLLYLAAAALDEEAMRRRAQALMEFTLAIAVPYVIVCEMFAEDVVGVIISPHQAGLAANIVTAAASQGGAVLVLYSLTSIALARKRFWLVASMVATTALSVTIAAFAGALAGAGLANTARWASWACLFVVLVWLVWSAATNLVTIRRRELTKLFFASSALWLASMGSSEVLSLTLGISVNWIFPALAGAVAFLVTALVLNLSGFIEMLPLVLQRHIAHLVKKQKYGA